MRLRECLQGSRLRYPASGGVALHCNHCQSNKHQQAVQVLALQVLTSTPAAFILCISSTAAIRTCDAALPVCKLS